MKRFFFALIALAGFLFAQSVRVGDMQMEYSTKKPLSSGSNEFVILLKKDGMPVRGAQVSLTAIMPPMPSMPKMNFYAQAKEGPQGYSAVLNLPHGGTWQLKFSIEVEGKKYTHKGSVDF